ncbi:hypothetical protein QP920_10360 [Corynebacterium marquesiae]|uniref:hypothetical protein n=1 Tax=Corynebacterium marquesiae TaxID=2913503 RepID=UPI00254FE839|nr:hypothetical protein [Corynebacterium marquesiae]MDK8496844.1 hypothetical protein [Corynebacterium marquesiae]
MTNPTRQQVINAHGALSSLTRLADNYLSSISDEDGEARQLRQFILRVIPPIPQPTMAEVEWDDDKHYLAEANYPYHGSVIMLSEKDGWIKYFDEREREVYDVLARALTPTGKCYTLTEVQDD